MNQKQHTVSTASERSTAGLIFWALSLVFGLVGIFVLWIVFFPLSLLCAIVSLLKRQYIIGSFGLLLSLVVLATSPSIWALYWWAKAVKEEMKNQEQVQQVAQEIATKKQAENDKKQEAIKKVGTDWLGKLKAAFAQSTDTGVEAFRNTSAAEFNAMLGNSDLKDDVLWVQKTMNSYVSDFTKKNGWKWSASEMTVLLKFLYFNAGVARMQIPADDENERQLFTFSMNTIEPAFLATEQGRTPEYAVTTRVYRDGKWIPGKVIVEKMPDGKFQLSKSLN